MVDRNLIRQFNVEESELEAALGTAFSTLQESDETYAERSYDLNQIVEGTVMRVDDGDVLVDIGYKSEGIVPLDEWVEDDDQPEEGSTYQFLLEEVEDDYGLVMLSKRKADRIREWEEVIKTHSEGDIVIGPVVRKIKGGLLINIGVNVFLPASQVDIRRPRDIADYIGQELKCIILKIDESRRNIVVSRRKLIEDERDEMKKNLLAEIEEKQLRKGVVKNIADFGAFVDLGGIDGLLHITDMSWGRINHPSEVVKIDEEIEVVILNIDREKEKIALGLKQKTPSPWEIVGDKYAVGTRVTGEVVNVMSYGAFVKLEEGIEGLVHISEMSWTKRVNHPSELVAIGDEVEIVVLGINEEKQEISLGMKQTQENPWDKAAEKYPPGSTITGTVRNLTNYGAFIELEEGVDGLLHISDMSWTRKISHANEMLKKGEEITCQIVSVDEDRKRIALGLKQLQEDPWETTIPEKFEPGKIVTGKVTKITNFGVFVELDKELEGLLHVSELSEKKIESPEELVSVGDDIEVRVLRVDTVDRKIGLSKRLDVSPEEQAKASEAEAVDLKGGMGDGSGPLFQMGKDEKDEVVEEAEEETIEESAEENSIETDESSTDESSTEESSTDESSTEESSTDESNKDE